MEFNLNVVNVYIKSEEEIMQTALKVLLSPMAFAIGFLIPLITQSLAALGISPFGIEPIFTGVVVGLALGAMAQFHGSWIGVKS